MENERQKLSDQVQIQILRNEIEHLKDDVDDLNSTIYNDGKGMVFDVRQLKNDKSSSAARWSTVISVLAVLMSLISVILQMLK